ncbi:MAG: type II toxin-antitoxin system MqsR family toxin [Stenotrophomonas acidaminiphila]
MTATIYDLERVHEAARCQRVFLNRTVQRDHESLGYTFNDVCKCLEELTLADYSGVFETDDGKRFDVYKPKFAHGPGLDALYVKLSEQSKATLPQVALGSFHLQRI